MNKKIKFCTFIFFFNLFIVCMSNLIYASDSLEKYAHLLELIRLEGRERPLIAFSDFEETFDQDLHKANMEFFNQHPDLIKKIKTDLNNGQSIQWRLENISHRLLYVPETREEFVSLYESYCNDIIGDILKLTELNNPHINIHTLRVDKPVYSENKGINAFIVHNLAKEYIATYVFSDKDQTEIKIRLAGKVFLKDIGSFSSYISLNENGSLEFTRKHQTIWQNNAKNPYTVLMTPVEETLHIVLRPYTEKAIRNIIKNSSIKTVTEVENVVDDWISVEEAIVGGLVHALLPSIIEKYIHNLSETLVELDIETKNGYPKYRHLKKGIKIVEELGYKKSINMYKADPKAFRDLLI